MKHIAAIRWKLPGLYRPIELRREIERRLGIAMGRNRLSYLMRIGVIPPGDRLAATRGPRGLPRRYWSDSLVKQIIKKLVAPAPLP